MCQQQSPPRLHIHGPARIKEAQKCSTEFFAPRHWIRRVRGLVPCAASTLEFTWNVTARDECVFWHRLWLSSVDRLVHAMEIFEMRNRGEFNWPLAKGLRMHLSAR